MTDREKAIKGLTCCITSEEDRECPDVCPYLDGCLKDGWMVGLALRKDALELLKEQEPRVLTLEELIGIYNLRKNHSWVYNTPPYFYMDYGKDTGYWIAWSNIVSCLERCYPKYIPEDYGKTWRCWSAKPTDEQREKVAWNG